MRLGLALFLATLVGLPATAFAQTAPVPPPRPERYSAATDEAGRPLSLNEIENAFEAFEQVTNQPVVNLALGEPQPVTLSARVSETGPIIPSGLTWRIYKTTPDENGQLPLLAKSSDAAAAFSLQPGQYVAHVAYGRAQASDTFTVEVGPNQRSLILDAGGLRLSAAVTGDVPIPASQLRFTIHANSDLTGGQVLIADNVAPGEILQLNAGVYKVVSTFGEVNAEVRADIRVEPGQLTDATLYFRAASVTLKLVSEPGGEAIADTDWTVSDAGGEIIFTTIGAFGSLVLAEGRYTVVARQGERVFSRTFEIVPGQPREIEVVTRFN
ncbi:MAG: hypothetical protein WEB63_06510 [Cucumibacter sp.]